MRKESTTISAEKPINNNYLKMIESLIVGIKYGTVTVIVQDGKIVQIEKNEKYRI